MENEPLTTHSFFFPFFFDRSELVVEPQQTNRTSNNSSKNAMTETASLVD